MPGVKFSKNRVRPKRKQPYNYASKAIKMRRGLGDFDKALRALDKAAGI